MAIMSAISGKLRPSINFSIFLNFSSDSSSIKSPRNFDGQVVGLGIVAAMNEKKDAREAAKMLVLAKSLPIPIVSSKPITSLREEESSSESVELAELSESYTCVISHLGKGNSISVMKRDHQSAINGDCKGKSGVFFASPMKNNIESPQQMYQTADFLSSCYLCRKNLHGLDIFMYRGDEAFCSVECRCKQILRYERKENSGSGALNSIDCSASPCSAPTLFSAGVVAA